MCYCKPRNISSLDLLPSHFVSQGRIWPSEKWDGNHIALRYYISAFPTHHNIESMDSLKILVACAYLFIHRGRENVNENENRYMSLLLVIIFPRATKVNEITS